MPQRTPHTLAARSGHPIPPDEVHIPPAVLDAAIRGGREWERLLRPRASQMVGGIGADTAAGLVHVVFEWLRQNGQTLLTCLSSGVSILVGLRQLAGGGAKSPEAVAPQPSDTQGAIASLEASIAVLRDRLAAQGQSPQQAAVIVRDLLEELEAEPATTREVVERLERRTRP